MKKIKLTLDSYDNAVREAYKKAKEYMCSYKTMDGEWLSISFDGYFVEEEKIVERVVVKINKSGYQNRVIKSFAV